MLTRAGATFAVYLKKNCITSINDAFKDYLEVQIRQEEMNVFTRGTSTILLEELRRYRKEYVEQVGVLARNRNGSCRCSCSIKLVKTSLTVT